MRLSTKLAWSHWLGLTKVYLLFHSSISIFKNYLIQKYLDKGYVDKTNKTLQLLVKADF